MKSRNQSYSENIDANSRLTDAIDKGAKLKMFEIGRSPGQILAGLW